MEVNLGSQKDIITKTEEKTTTDNVEIVSVMFNQKNKTITTSIQISESEQISTTLWAADEYDAIWDLIKTKVSDRTIELL